MVMSCTHVLEDGEPVAESDEETLICQKCSDALDSIPEGEESTENIPKEVHLFCKGCVLKKLKIHLDLKLKNKIYKD